MYLNRMAVANRMAAMLQITKLRACGIPVKLAALETLSASLVCAYEARLVPCLVERSHQLRTHPCVRLSLATTCMRCRMHPYAHYSLATGCVCVAVCSIPRLWLVRRTARTSGRSCLGNPRHRTAGHPAGANARHVRGNARYRVWAFLFVKSSLL
jgi:hypothetical protein